MNNESQDKLKNTFAAFANGDHDKAFETFSELDMTDKLIFTYDVMPESFRIKAFGTCLLAQSLLFDITGLPSDSEDGLDALIKAIQFLRVKAGLPECPTSQKEDTH